MNENYQILELQIVQPVLKQLLLQSIVQITTNLLTDISIMNFSKEFNGRQAIQVSCFNKTQKAIERIAT